MENGLLNGIFFRGSGDSYNTVLDFSIMREGDYIKNLHVRNAFLENMSSFAELSEKCKAYDIRTENIVSDTPEGEKNHYIAEVENV